MNLLPAPKTEEEVAAAHARFKARVNTGKPNYYYLDPDNGEVFYYENKGSSVIGKRNKASKYSNNWGRDVRLKDVTPELKDFEEALGDKNLAKKAFKEMKSDMNLLQKNLAKLNASQQRGFALDHFDPVAKKGLNVPWYLRIMESGPNSAKGAKMPLTPDQLARMGFFKNKVHAIKARYLGVESIQGSLGGSGIDLNWDDMDEVFEYASSGKNSKQVDKYIDDVFKRRTIAIREGGEAIRKRHNIKPVSNKRYGNIVKGVATTAGSAIAWSIVNPDSSFAAGRYAATGDKEYLKEVGIEAGKDLAVQLPMRAALMQGVKAASKVAAKQLTGKALLSRAVPYVGTGLLAWSLYDVGDAFVKGATNKSIYDHIKDATGNEETAQIYSDIANEPKWANGLNDRRSYEAPQEEPEEEELFE
mgnify:CR=1 FL=1|tara:strand:- start:43 stop:1293 length:1251 start_codon:yes stop_codon:yes gene_type:complete